MKKAAILLTIIFAISSCSLFEKPSMTQEEIDKLVNQKAAVEQELVNLKQDYELLRVKAEECAQMFDQQTKKEVITGKYFVVAGSFKNSKYADDYAAKLKQAGGSGTILEGPSNFKFVVYSSHQTLKDAAESMYKVRDGISLEAWIYQIR